MRKFIRTVTITGIDVYTDRGGLDGLSYEFPFVEWGVLLSKTKEGKDNRYPNKEWIDELGDQRLRLSGHICGLWARDIAEGGDMILRDRPDWFEKPPLFQRLQLNISHILGDISSPYEPFHNAVRRLGIKTIIQLRDLDRRVLQPLVNEVDFLFDCSGGRGVLPARWPALALYDAHGGRSPLSNCGYAGGLNPDNLAEQLALMEASSEGQTIWIDVESGVRTSDVLDLDKVHNFLSIAKPYVIDEQRITDA